MSVSAVEQQIRARGLRCTAQRIAVMSVLGESGRHLRVDEIAERVRERLGAVSTQAVYDALGALGGAGLVRRTEPAGSPALYELRSGDNHHHLVCRSCGTVLDTDCVTGSAPCLEPVDDAGFLIDEAEVTFWGLCSACRAGAGGERRGH